MLSRNYKRAKKQLLYWLENSTIVTPNEVQTMTDQKAKQMIKEFEDSIRSEYAPVHPRFWTGYAEVEQFLIQKPEDFIPSEVRPYKIWVCLYIAYQPVPAFGSLQEIVLFIKLLAGAFTVGAYPVRALGCRPEGLARRAEPSRIGLLIYLTASIQLI